MSNKVKISEVLHLAADKYLASDYVEYIDTDKSRFSCCAVEGVLDDLLVEEGIINIKQYTNLWDTIHEGFENLGLDTGSLHAFEEFEKGEVTEESQGARYAWLKFCAMLAEEQGE